MATAITVPSPLNLVSGTDFSVNLATAVLDPVSTRPLQRVAMNVGVRTMLADPRPIAMQKDGGVAPVHGHVVLGRVHVIPRRIDLGAVVSDQEAEVEVWNAAIDRAQILGRSPSMAPPGSRSPTTSVCRPTSLHRAPRSTWSRPSPTATP